MLQNKIDIFGTAVATASVIAITFLGALPCRAEGDSTTHTTGAAGIYPAPSQDAPPLIQTTPATELHPEAKCRGWVRVWFYVDRRGQQVFIEGWLPNDQLATANVEATLPEECPDAPQAAPGSPRRGGATRAQNPTATGVYLGLRAISELPRSQLGADGLTKPEDSGLSTPHYGVGLTGAYQVSQHLAAQFDISTAQSGNFSGEVEIPQLGQTITRTGLRSRTLRVGTELLASYPLGVFEGKGLLGYHLLDWRIDAVSTEDGILLMWDSHRYAGPVVGAGISVPGRAFRAGVIGWTWFFAQSSQRHMNPETGNGLTGRATRPIGIGVRTNVDRLVGAKTAIGLTLDFERWVTRHTGEGFRFAQDIEDATVADTLFSYGVRAEHRF